MSMVCPRCNASFEDRYTCPMCGIALTAAPTMAADSGVLFKPEAKWQQTALGRGVVGLLLAQGLYYGLWQLGTAVMMATVDESQRADWWSTWPGWSVRQVLLVISLIVGGMMAGAGQRRGLLHGGLLGVVNGLLFLVVPKGAEILPLGSSEEFQDIIWYGQPLLQAVVGAIGGLIGATVWRPMLSVTAPAAPRPATPILTQRLVMTPSMPAPSGFSGPVAWPRVIVGTMIALLGSAWANMILNYMNDATGGRMVIESITHARFVTWEISVIALIIGSATAGATTRNGMKQGLLVGAITGFGLLAIHLQQEGSLRSVPAPTMWWPVLRPHEIVEQWSPGFKVSLTFATMLPMGLLGGWFGSQLLPPLAGSGRRKRLFAEV